MNNPNPNATDRFVAKTSQQVAKTAQKLQDIQQLLPKDIGDGIRQGLFKIPNTKEGQLNAGVNEVDKDNSKYEVGYKKDTKTIGTSPVSNVFLNKINDNKDELTKDKTKESETKYHGVACRFLDQIKDPTQGDDEKHSRISNTSKNQVKINIGTKDDKTSRTSTSVASMKEGVTKSASSNNGPTKSPLNASKFKQSNNKSISSMKESISSYQGVVAANVTKFASTVKDEDPTRPLRKKDAEKITPSKNDFSKPLTTSSETPPTKPLTIKESINKSASSVKEKIGGYQNVASTNITKFKNNNKDEDPTRPPRKKDTNKLASSNNASPSPLLPVENTESPSLKTCSFKETITKSASSVKETINSYHGAVTTNVTKFTSNLKDGGWSVKDGVLTGPSSNKDTEKIASSSKDSPTLRSTCLSKESPNDLKKRISRDLNLVLGGKSPRVSMDGSKLTTPKDSPVRNRFSNSSNISDLSFMSCYSTPEEVFERKSCPGTNISSTTDESIEEKGRKSDSDISTNIDLNSVAVETERLSHLSSNRARLSTQLKQRRLPSKFSKQKTV